MATSQNGWPALAPDSPKLHTWVIPAKNGTFRLRTRNGSAGFLLCYLALWFSEKLEDVTQRALLDDWGYAYRPVRSSSDLSNHASGTAIDLNATWHPLGEVRTGIFRRVKAREKLNRRLARMRNTLRWGGNYNGRKDEMHFELNVNITQAEREAQRLSRTRRGRRLLAANPGQKKVIWS